MADHILIHKHWYMLTAIMNSDSQANHIGGNHGASRPSLDWSTVIAFYRGFNFLHQMKIDKRALL